MHMRLSGGTPILSFFVSNFLSFMRFPIWLDFSAIWAALGIVLEVLGLHLGDFWAPYWGPGAIRGTGWRTGGGQGGAGGADFGRYGIPSGTLGAEDGRKGGLG